MASCSKTPVAGKLGLAADKAFAVMMPPPGFLTTLRGRGRPVARGRVDVVLLFARSCKQLDAKLRPAMSRLAQDGAMWIVWPKKASGIITDLSFAAVQSRGLAHGYVDVKICAVDETWSGLKFVRRRFGGAKSK
jgi:hypothetical protein